MEVLILGFHRSHTSVIAQWLKENGLFIGSNLLKSSAHNQKGYFEDLDFLSIHLDILKYNNCDRSGIFKIASPSINSSQKLSLKRLIRARNISHTVWGFKEPRTALFLNFYNSVLDAPYYIVIVRPFNETIASILKREFGTANWNYKSLFRSPKKFVLNHFYYPNKVLKAWIAYNERFYELINENNWKGCLILTRNLKEDEKQILSILQSDEVITNNKSFDLFFNSTLTHGKRNSFLLSPILKRKAKDLMKKFTRYYHVQLRA